MTRSMKTFSSNRTQSNGDVPAVIALLHQQKELYEKLDVLSDHQSVLVGQGDTDQLLAVLAQRQALVDGLVALNGKMQPYREKWDAVAGGMNAACKAQVNGLVDEVERLLAQILKRDELTQGQLQTAKTQVGQELAKTNQGGAAASAYSKGTAANAYAAQSKVARFMDNRG
ncbi:flagellar export chaperone FlgN [Poriferisphaera sp. WC338]|uniref:flagellar export chaperone FlgN n=1 Tax=Poriferisphaera sp. WC338 TaxID=3425129 RepID=UPI003D813234